MSKQPDSYAIILAEDVRPEADGKFTLAGIFTGGLSISRVPGESFGLASLAAYSEFYNIHGSYNIKIILKDPAGVLIAQADVPNSSKEPEDQNMTLAGKFQNVKFISSGMYEFAILLDDIYYVKTFSVELLEESS